MAQKLFRIFVGKKKAEDAQLLNTLQSYVKRLGVVEVLQGYDLLVDDLQSCVEFSEWHLADCVCDWFCVEDCSAAEAGGHDWKIRLKDCRSQYTSAAFPSDYLAYETPAAQFDPRAQAVKDCWNLWAAGGAELKSVRCFQLYLFGPKYPVDGSKELAVLRKEDLRAIHKYFWNPLELQIKDLDKFSFAREGSANAASRDWTALLDVNGLAQLNQWANDNAMRFDTAALSYIQAYYRREDLLGLKKLAAAREPSPTELRILEAYWSDHCRHTTFHTELQWDWGNRANLPKDLFGAYQLYCDLRQRCKIENRPQSFMDIAILGARQLQGSDYMRKVEVSAEVNACSVFVDVEDMQGGVQKRLLMFKNETHNHPTEIEPYGGASTCLGGAIRDPLSGRSYVYQALRLSGAASPQQSLREPRKGKLSQRKIAREAARGFSDYGNRIGIATNLVWELYHPGFEAKRFECGMVVGVAQPEQVKRLEPEPGDLILLLGGATGRDGIGGASGSSNAHDRATVSDNSSEVQRGNPLEERKLQRFFRRSDVGCYIKRCNDFGAGGVAVAVGEIARGVDIELSAIPTKYEGLRPEELATSESQERMAVVIAPQHGKNFRARAESEGIEIVELGRVSADECFRLSYRGQEVANLARDFLDSGGFSRSAELRFSADYLQGYNPAHYQKILLSLANDLAGEADFVADSKHDKACLEAKLCRILSLPQIASQRGLQHIFDSSVGASSAFQPYPHWPVENNSNAGAELRTYGRCEVSAQMIPLHFWGQHMDEVAPDDSVNFWAKESRLASLISFAYDAQLSSGNSFLGAQVAVVQSVGKLIAAGASRLDIYLSFQEYFPRLESPELWGQVGAALLGALQAQHRLGLAAIGGKDSMSGSFEELKVPPVLASFAFGTSKNLRPSNWKSSARHLYLLAEPQDFSDLQSPNFERAQGYWQLLEGLDGLSGESEFAARQIGPEGILATVALFSFGSTAKRIVLADPDVDGVKEKSWLLPYASDSSFAATLLASSEPLPKEFLEPEGPRELEELGELGQQRKKPRLQYLASLEDCKAGEQAIVMVDKDSGSKELSLAADSLLYRAWCRFEGPDGHYPTDSGDLEDLGNAGNLRDLEEAAARDASTKRRMSLLQNAAQSNMLAKAEKQEAPEKISYPISRASSEYRHSKIRTKIVVPVFPGSNSEDDMLRSFARAALQFPNLDLELHSPVIRLRDASQMQESLGHFAELLEEAQILALPGGFSASDEPDGSAKFLATALRQKRVAAAIDALLARDALILGICNGFQALIKTGLLPYGRNWQQGKSYGRNGLSITQNRQGRHIADLELCRVCPTASPWLDSMQGKDYLLPISHGEGRIIMPAEFFDELRRNKQVAAVYHSDVNGSYAGIEALCSADGRILGKMAHSERCGPALYQNMATESALLQQDLFTNGLGYFASFARAETVD